MTLRELLEFQWLNGVGLGWVTALVVIAYAALLAYGASRSSDFIFEGAPDRRPARDLRFWLAPIVIIQIALYVWLS